MNTEQLRKEFERVRRALMIADEPCKYEYHKWTPMFEDALNDLAEIESKLTKQEEESLHFYCKSWEDEGFYCEEQCDRCAPMDATDKPTQDAQRAKEFKNNFKAKSNRHRENDAWAVELMEAYAKQAVAKAERELIDLLNADFVRYTMERDAAKSYESRFRWHGAREAVKSVKNHLTKEHLNQ